MRSSLRFALAGLLLAVGVVAQAQKLPLGAAAPSVGKVQSVQGKPLARFEPGKVYVLEFWATWCGACRPAIPHMNELAKKYSGKPLEIYSVTDEEPSKVDPFLKRFPMSTNVVAGAEGLLESFGVRLLPTTILIDKKGRVAAFTRPEKVTESVLDALLEERKIDLPVEVNKPASLDWDKEIVANSVGHVLLRYTDSDGGGSRFVPDSGQITGDGLGLKNLFMLAHNVEYADFQWKGEADDTRYRISVKAANGQDDTARAMLADTLVRTFPLKSEWQSIEREVYVLRAKGPVTLKPSTGPSNEGGARQGSIVWPDATSKVLANLLASFGVGKTVIDETGLTARYALSLSWTPGDLASLRESLAKVGLELTKETRTVPTFVVTPRH